MTGLRGGPTQDEVMAISLQKLGLREGDRFADIGCGTGKVSIAAARTASVVYAVDAREEAVECARKEVVKSGATNVRLVHGSAVDFLVGPEAIDCAFVGGSKDLEEILGLLQKKEVRSVVVNAVMVSTLHRAVERMKELGMFKEAIHVQVSRSHDIAGGVMFKPIDPVYIIVGGAD